MKKPLLVIIAVAMLTLLASQCCAQMGLAKSKNEVLKGVVVTSVTQEDSMERYAGIDQQLNDVVFYFHHDKCMVSILYVMKEDIPEIVKMLDTLYIPLGNAVWQAKGGVPIYLEGAVDEDGRPFVIGYIAPEYLKEKEIERDSSLHLQE